MKKRLIFLPFAVMALMTMSCSSESEDDLVDPVDDGPAGNEVTYVGNIRSVINSNCIGCHASPPTNGAPFSLTTFDDVKNRASGILNAISKEAGESRAMPPSGRLPQATIDLFQQWIDDGTLEN